LEGRAEQCARQALAGAPAAFSRGGGRCRLRLATVGPYTWRAVLSMESVRALAAALHRRLESPASALGLHQPRHGLLGPAQTLAGAVGNYAFDAGRCEIILET